MIAPLLAAVLTAAVPTRIDTTDAAGPVVRRALHAVEEDSAAPLRDRWSAQLRADSTDRAALLGLATLARLAYDYPTSDRLYSRLAVADSLRQDGYTAYARLGLAWSLEERGRSDDAAEAFVAAREAARAIHDSAAQAEALIGRSFARGSAEGMTVVLALLDTAGTLIPASAPGLEAERRWRRALILGIAADPRATAEAASAVELARRAGDLRAEAQALRGLAKVLDWRGRDDSALAALDEAEARFRRAREHSWLAVTLMNRANTLRKRGDLGATLEALRGALAEGERSNNGWAVASAHTGLGVVAMQLADLPGADEHLNRAVKMFEALGDRSSAVNARKFLPLVVLAEGDTAAARRQALEALAYYRSTGETLDQFGLHQTLAVIAAREDDWPAAAQALADAKALLPRLDGAHWATDLAFDEGRVALARGDLAAAERSFLRFQRAIDTSRHVSRYDVRLRLADIHAQRHDLDGAEREASLAWGELERWRAGLTDRELRLHVFQALSSEVEVSPANVSEQRASVARVLAALAAGGKAARAFDLAERRRARELMDRMVRAEALVTETAAGTARPVPASASAADVASLIPDRRTALLEYVTGSYGSPTTLLVLTRATSGGVPVRSYPLPPADSLAGALARFLALVQRRGEDRGVARALAAALLEPALRELGDSVDRLILVPDGPLHRVPWDLLRLADGRYVVERYAVSVVPSAAVLAALWRRPLRAASPPGPVELLAFGNPDLGDRAHRAARELEASVPPDAELGPLAGADREARLVAGFAPEATVRVGGEASESYLEHAALDRYRVIHFATHAVVDERSAVRTMLILAPDATGDGLVGPGDLAALRLDADLVVLSGCRTAGGVLVEGEGLQGLTAPLLQAGARSVVASQWRIRDRSIVALIEAFYRSLAEGLPAGDALRAAKIDALRRGAAPAEWAAFTLVGDPLIRVPLEPRQRPNWRWAALSAGLTSVAGGMLYWYRRRRSADW